MVAKTNGSVKERHADRTPSRNARSHIKKKEGKIKRKRREEKGRGIIYIYLQGKNLLFSHKNTKPCFKWYKIKRRRTQFFKKHFLWRLTVLPSVFFKGFFFYCSYFIWRYIFIEFIPKRVTTLAIQSTSKNPLPWITHLRYLWCHCWF